MQELWLDIPSLPGYAASSMGHVRNAVTGRELAQHGKVPMVRTPSRFGGSHRTVARLVCEAFHGAAPLDKPQTAHMDGCSANNGVFNLYWASQAENEEDKRLHGTWDLRKTNVKLSEAAVADIRRRAALAARTPKGQLPKGFNKAIAEEYGITSSNVTAIVNGISWRISS